MKPRSFTLVPRGLSKRSSSKGPLGFAETAGWLANRLLWVDGWFTSSSQGPLTVGVEIQGEEFQVEAQRFSHHRADLEKIPGASGQILLIPTPDLGADLLSVEKVWIQLDSVWYRWSRLRLPVLPDLSARFSEKVDHFPPDTRQAFIDFLVDVLRPEENETDPFLRRNSPHLQRSLPELFKPLKEDAKTDSPPPSGHVGYADQEAGLGIERCWQVNENTLLVEGWLWDVAGRATGLALVDAAGRRILPSSAFRFQHAEITETYRPHFADRAEGDHGFWFRLELPEDFGKPQIFQLDLENNQSMAVAAPLPGNEIPVIRRHLCQEAMRHLRTPNFLAQIFEPSWHALNTRLRHRLSLTEIHGPVAPPKTPKHSLIIPVGEDLRWIEHQLAQLAGTSGLEHGEILYVLRTAQQAEHFESHLQMLAQLYRLPLRGLIPDRDLNNDSALHAGAQAARGDLLVFLEETVFCGGHQDWLKQLTEQYEGLDNPGVIGPKLLYEDFSLASAGLEPKLDQGTLPSWTFLRKYEGLPGSFPAANTTQQVTALGGCLALSRQLFEQLDGFHGIYLEGETAQVDLSLQCLAAGRTNWYTPEIELFHLPELAKEDVGFFGEGVDHKRIDRWLLTQRWDDLLRAAVTP